jgi:hypothetical protein
MSESEAKQWIGRSMSIGDVSTSLDGERLSGGHVTEQQFNSEQYFGDDFKILPSALGFADPKVHVVDLILT